MEYEHLSLKELQNLCIGRGLKKSGTKAELIERLYENDTNNSDEINFNSQSTSSFSFAGIIVAVLFGYITYKFYPFVKGVDKVYNYLNSDDFLPKLFLEYLNSASDGKFSSMFSFFHIWFWALLISYGIKTIISISHSFNPSRENITYIAWTAIILEVLPIFFKTWSINSFEDAIQIMLIVYIPTILGIALLYSKEKFS